MTYTVRMGAETRGYERDGVLARLLKGCGGGGEPLE